MLTIAMRWADRLIGLVSTLILARLLVPNDFGIIAMASLVISLTDVFLDLGVGIALVQNKQAEQSHFNAAWTLRLLQAGTATLLLMVAAPWAADYFREPQVETVVRVLSIGFLLSALENIGIVCFQKEMNFAAEFRFQLLKRVIGFCTTISCAFIWQSYWALVAGTLSSRAIGSLISYAAHPMRPHFSFSRVGEIFGVSQWILLRSASVFLDNKLHHFFVGRRESASLMGAYSMADELSMMPTTEILAPLNRVLFPLFVAVRDDLIELRRLFRLSLEIQTLIGIPAGVGLALVAKEAVSVLLGEKWLVAVPFVEIIALTSVVQAITSSGAYVLLSLGKVRFNAIYSVIQVATFFLLVTMAIPNGGAISIAWLRLAVACFGIVVFYSILMRNIHGLRKRDIVSSVARPVGAALAMVGAVAFLPIPTGWPAAAILVLKVTAGAASYASCVILLWLASGRPQGAETYLLEKLQSVRRSRAG